MDNHQHHHQTPPDSDALTPYVLLFPLPFQGPVNCYLKLAELFCFHGLRVTFLITDYVQRRLLCYTDISSRFRPFADRIRFETVPDGLPEDNPRTGDQVWLLLDSMEAASSPAFREIVRSGSNDWSTLSCIIADGAFSFAVDIGREFGVSVMYFDTLSACGLWTYLCANRLIEAGEFPFQDDNLETTVASIPGMEGFLRRRDLPSFYRTSDINDPTIRGVLKEEQKMRLAQGLILNSFEELEGPILSQLQTLVPNLYAIGPFHTHHKIRLAEGGGEEEEAWKLRNSTNSIWQEDKTCISWLDKQPDKSVIYVSIGSLALLTKEQFTELRHGLVNSGLRFLWVQRPGSIAGLADTLWELDEATKERGRIVSWAPQEEVLAHPAVGGFLTHSGWNSTLESVVEGVPMICWPYFADQQVNSRYVGEVWKLGLVMKDTFDRGDVEEMIMDVMVDRKDEFLQRLEGLAKLAKDCVSKGGSSYGAFDRLLLDIKSMCRRSSIV